METKHVAMNENQQKEPAAVVNKLCKENKTEVLADLDSRLSYRDEGKVQWGAYSCFLCKSGHTIYVNLRTMEGSYSKEVDKFAQGNVEKRAARAAKVAARKTARLQKEEERAAKKEAADFDKLAKTVKADKPISKAKAKTVVHNAVDEAVQELEAGATTSSKKHNAKKTAKVPVVKFDKKLSTLEA